MVYLNPSQFQSSSNGCTLCARSGWVIPIEYQAQPTPEEQRNLEYKIEYTTQKYLNEFGHQIRLRSTSKHGYNCVGLVFASRRVWIRDQYIRRILKEDGYRQIQRKEVRIGDIIVYTNRLLTAVHIGIVFDVRTDFDGKTPRCWVVSKWGDGAEFEHFEDAVPSLYKNGPLEFYTDRT